MWQVKADWAKPNGLGATNKCRCCIDPRHRPPSTSDPLGLLHVYTIIYHLPANPIVIHLHSLLGGCRKRVAFTSRHEIPHGVHKYHKGVLGGGAQTQPAS